MMAKRCYIAAFEICIRCSAFIRILFVYTVLVWEMLGKSIISTPWAM